MKMKYIPTLTLLLSLFSLQSIANDAKEKIYLIQIINQLEATKQLIIAANNEQIKYTRIKFHYTFYDDANGVRHNGLLEDIQAVQQGIQEKLNQTSIEPRHFEAIKGDYLDHENVQYNPTVIAAGVDHVK